MRQRGFVTILIFLVVVVLGVIGYLLFTNARPTNSIPQSYVNSKYGFTFEIPKGYYLASCSSLEDQRAVQEGLSTSEWRCMWVKNDNYKGVLIGIDQNPDNLTAKGWVDRAIRDKEAGRDAFDYTSTEEVMTKGGSAFQIVNDTGETVDITLFFQLSGQDMLDIRYHYPKSNQDLKNMTDELVKSVTTLK